MITYAAKLLLIILVLKTPDSRKMLMVIRRGGVYDVQISPP